MIKKIKRLLKNKIVNTVLIMIVFCIGVIKITPIMVRALQMAQKMQRMGKHSSLQDSMVLIVFICLTIMIYIIYHCIICIGIEINRMINKKRRQKQDFLKKDCEKRILRKILFEEIKGGVPIPDEEGLWETLGQLTAEELEEAREERKQLLYEMEEKAVGG